jgi:hypothetical protein
MNAETNEAELDSGLADLASMFDKPENQEEDIDQGGDGDKIANRKPELPAQDDAAEDEEANEAPPTALKWGAQEIALPEGTAPEVAQQLQELSSAMNADYTQKTQEVARQRNEIPHIVRQAVEPQRAQYMHGLQQASMLIQNIVLPELNGVQLTPQFAAQNPAQYLAVQARQQEVSQILGAINQAISDEKTSAAQYEEAQRNTVRTESAQVLKHVGFDENKLHSLYSQIHEQYGLPQELFAQIDNYQAVAVMCDALAYRQLQAQKPELKNRVAAAANAPMRQRAPSGADANNQKQATMRLRKSGSIKDLASSLGDF